ncbi:hypothetical protein CDL12_13991 [Handroanthus impetiginosus]|uniref:Uncharacterized protein n=1 Tax=Handroanthus impetiginosus TaxID=429701 RepID=A0A2G9H7V5_9LAMI|nr:hypothetical protein CDL12_13991 [Handroanthus impetiginosus]
MDACEATKAVMLRIQSLDAENASRIMGYILIQDQGEKEIIRLAFSSDSLLLSRINQVKACLGLPSNIPSNGFSTTLLNPIRPNYPFVPQTSRQNLVRNNGFYPNTLSPKPISYAAVLNGSYTGCNNGLGSSNLNICGGNDLGNELSFAADSMVDQNPIKSPSERSDSLVFPYREDVNNIPSPHPHPLHRGSCSTNDAAFLSNLEEGRGDVGGFGWKPCVYFARGFCKNGNFCKFLHSEIGVGETVEVGSPSVNNSGFDEFLRIKALQQQQRLGFMAPHNKNMNFLDENQRYDYSPTGHGAAANSNERQIYLTFPADSTFNEEDVSAYFSKFGPVQDVRIPYQHPKRMFGFVTFVQAETVKLIFAKGNPHYVCDCRVLVKPYKDKAKLLDKKQTQQQHQHLERGEYSACLRPPGIDPRELFDLPIRSPQPPNGSRMLFNTQEMMLRRKLEQETELQHAIELQRRRMMNLQLMDLNNQNHNHHFLPSPPVGVPFSSPRQSQWLMSQNVISDSTNQDVLQEFDYGEETSPGVAADDVEGTNSSTNDDIVNGNNQQRVNDDDFSFPERFEHVLPENLFTSPTKSAVENQSVFSNASAKADNSIPVNNTSSDNFPVARSSSPLSKFNPYHSQTTRNH